MAHNAKDDVSLLWKAAFCRTVQLRRGQWLRVDLTDCLRAIRAQLRIRRRVSLSYLANLYLGLCRIMSSQLSHTCDNIDWPRFEFEQLAPSQVRTTNTAQSDLDRLFNSDPLLQAFMVTSAQFELFSMEELLEDITGPSLLPPSIVSSLDVADGNAQLADSEEQAKLYFEELYGQMNSVDFLDEFQMVLQDHFGAHQQDARDSQRFSDLHAHESSFTEMQSTHSDGGENMDVYEEPLVDTLENGQTDQSLSAASQSRDCPVLPKRPSAVRRKRNKLKQTRPKKLFGLKLHFDEWRKSKDGYRFLIGEGSDSKLSEPSRLMHDTLKQYFRCASNSSKPCPEPDNAPAVFNCSTETAECAPNISGEASQGSCNENLHLADFYQPFDDHSAGFVSPLAADYLSKGESSMEHIPITAKSLVIPFKKREFPKVGVAKRPVVSTTKAAVQLNDRQMMYLLNTALHSVPGESTTLGEPTKMFSFSALLASMESPSKRMVVRSFCTLVHLTTRPGTGIKLHQKAATGVNRLRHFTDLTISFKASAHFQ